MGGFIGHFGGCVSTKQVSAWRITSVLRSRTSRIDCKRMRHAARVASEDILNRVSSEVIFAAAYILEQFNVLRSYTLLVVSEHARRSLRRATAVICVLVERGLKTSFKFQLGGYAAQWLPMTYISGRRVGRSLGSSEGTFAISYIAQRMSSEGTLQR